MSELIDIADKHSTIKFVTHIADSVHGVIPVTELERRVIDSPEFQRLRNIKQLGLAYLVFPSADYSRFAHCLGAMNVMGQFMSTLQNSYEEAITSTVVEVFRLTALLHDIGHYPMSHLYEDAMKNYHIKQGKKTKIFDHEKAGGYIIANKLKALIDDSDLGARFLSELRGNSPYENKLSLTLSEFISGVLTKDPVITGIEPYSAVVKLISGAIDCDRLDYLLRTATGSKTPYGRVDNDYLINNISYDPKRRPYSVQFKAKTIHAVMHMLEGRIYDYLTSSYHKTVKSLELRFSDAVEEGMIKLDLPKTEEEVKSLIDSRLWLSFDDSQLKNRLLTEEESTKKLTEFVFHRKPRKCIISVVSDFSKQDVTKFYASNIKTFPKVVQEKLNLDKRFIWFVGGIEALDGADTVILENIISKNFNLKNSQYPLQKMTDRFLLVIHGYNADGHKPTKDEANDAIVHAMQSVQNRYAEKFNAQNSQLDSQE
jgi:HD superfamily phosphohydrolase